MEIGALPEGTVKRQAVQTMFDRIAPRYDRLNRILSVGLDQRWRTRALDAIGVGNEDRVVDLACGTGDLAELAGARGARVVAVDFAREMLRSGRVRGVRTAWVQGDAAALPLPRHSASALVCGFALRNFVALAPVFDEMARVLEPGGRIALLDVDRPDGRALRAGHTLWFDRVVPRLGGWLSDRAAYRYLPQSTAYLPPAAELRALLEKAGFRELRRERFLFGSAQLWTGVRA